MDKAFIMLLKHLFILYCDGKKQENLHRLAGRVAMKFSLCEKKNPMFKFNRISCCKICLNNLGLPFRTQGWILRGKLNPP